MLGERREESRDAMDPLPEIDVLKLLVGHNLMVIDRLIEMG